MTNVRVDSDAVCRILGVSHFDPADDELSTFEPLEARAMLSARFGGDVPTAPAMLAAAALGPTTVELSWSQARSATGYALFRSELTGPFREIGRVNSGTQLRFTDSTVTSNRAYRYTIASIVGSAMSAQGPNVLIVTPLTAPSQFNVTLVSATSAKLTWQGTDPSATGYIIVRSIDGAAHKPLVMLQGGSRREFTDSTLVSGTAYTYRVQAMAGSKMSALTDPANVATALASPQGLRATPGTSSIALAWTAVDAKATGLNVQRSVAGGAFTTIASLGTAVRAFTDSTAATGTAYTYRLVATKPNIPSGTSATAAATIAAPARPANPGVAGITISTRYGNELVITATTGNAPIEVTKSGANLRIMSGTTQLSSIAMPGSLFIYDRGGTHAIRIDASVGIRTTVSSVGGGTSNITSAHSNVSVWMDTTDQFTGSGTVHRVGTLAGNVSKAVGISLANPSDSGRTVDANASLWGSGPVAADVNQGAVGDCYLLASLAAFAVSKPSVLLESAVDLGDSTYLVQFMRQNAPVYVRVSDDLPSPSGRNMQFARPGSSGTVWAPVMEKAFAYFRTGANTYASISGGWMADAYTALGVRSSTITMGMTSTAFFSMVSSAFNSGKAVTFGTSNSAPSLVRGHAYTLVGVSRDAGGVARYTFRNPWGASGTSIENAAGITTLTFEQMQANFTVGVMAA